VLLARDSARDVLLERACTNMCVILYAALAAGLTVTPCCSVLRDGLHAKARYGMPLVSTTSVVALCIAAHLSVAPPAFAVEAAPAPVEKPMWKKVAFAGVMLLSVSHSLLPDGISRETALDAGKPKRTSRGRSPRMIAGPTVQVCTGPSCSMEWRQASAASRAWAQCSRLRGHPVFNGLPPPAPGHHHASSCGRQGDQHSAR